MFISLDQAIVPSLIPQTAPMATTGWNSNWLIGGALGVALLLGWIGLGHSKTQAAKATGRRARKVKVRKAPKRKAA